jgi:hypothetical protein
MKESNVSVLVGKTLTRVQISEDEIIFVTVDGETFKMYHDQNCCEGVQVEEVIGDVADLLNTPIVVAEERSQDAEADEVADCGVWTFYEIRTIQGSVTIRWLGESNGYYSMDVDFVEL